MNKNLKKTLLKITGVFLLVLGVLGLALPFLQGFLFIIVGLLLLSKSSETIKTWLEVHTAKYLKLDEIRKKSDVWLKYFVGEV